jgi:predicted oxidoreductase (fatty acid repression mutant protein)
MKKIPITLTLPESLIKDLHLYISRGQISKFVAQMVTKGLETEKQKLAKEFQEASQDSERNAEIEIWDTLIGDGIDEANPY